MPGVEEASANVATPHETAPLSTNSIDSIDTINTMDNISTINDVSNGINTGEEKRGCACVTGAGGFIATWLVKTLLDKGYTVKGTLRNPDDEKNAHLMTLERAKERLTLVKADLEDRASITKAFKGCDAVFHLASPVTDNPIQMVDPALNGMLNVLNACVENGVKRIVFTSSIGSIYMDPQRDPSVIVDESCWSSLEYCKDTKNWYCYGKTLAEKTAWEYAKKIGVDLVVLAPSVVLGPLLQPTINASTMHLLKFVNGSTKRYTNHVQAYVDVRDVALACILLYETPSASGRYLCAENILHRGEVAEILINFFPQFPIPTKCSDEKNPRAKPYQFSNMKLRNLGFNFTPIKQCLYDTIISLKQKGIIQEPLPVEMANLDSPS